MTKYSHIIEFYGETCPHCLSMRPVIKQLEKDLGGEITKLEVWGNTENAAKMAEYESIISDACGGMMGVPNFVNTQTKQALCGAQDEAMLKELIEDGDCKNGVCMPHTKMLEKPAK